MFMVNKTLLHEALSIYYFGEGIVGMYTIWLMPIHPSPSQHGFGVIDCFRMNLDFCDYRCEPMDWYADRKGDQLSANN